VSKRSPEEKAKRAAYMRAWNERKRGYPSNQPGRPANTPETLWSKVDKRTMDECWPWIGTIKGGYGRTEINDRAYYAHRVIFDLANPGLISREGPGMKADTLVLHRCNNKICCNPAHLYLGTQKDNMQDRLKTGDGYRNLPRGDAHWQRRRKMAV
jgi:hypothetical protein